MQSQSKGDLVETPWPFCAIFEAFVGPGREHLKFSKILW